MAELPLLMLDTITSSTPAALAGTVAVMDEAELTVKLSTCTGVEPEVGANSTLVADVK